MAYIIVNNSLNNSAGVQFTATTDDSTDWVLVPLDTYFYDFQTKLVYYKDVSGNVISLYQPDAGGSVTSVGLTMPSAFNVSNSPITTSGSIDVTANGTASQYIRGDGQLAQLPTNTGGGSAVTYYLNGSVNQGTFGGNTYYQLSKNAIAGAGTDFSTGTDGVIARFLTDANDPDLLSIPSGSWNIAFYFSASSSGGTPNFYCTLYKYDGATFTSIASNSAIPEQINGGTTIDRYYTAISVPTTSLTATDRLAIVVNVVTDGRTITLHTEDSHFGEIVTTFSTGLTALNGLTDQVQYLATGTSGTDFAINSSGDTHTFNLPVASATNTGKLSSTDWTTFNNKVSTNIYNGDGTLTGSRVVTLGAYGLRLLGGAGAGTIRFDKQDAGSGLYTSYNQSISDISAQVINGTNSVSTTLNSVLLQNIVTDGVSETTTFSQENNLFTLNYTDGVINRNLFVGTSGIGINGEYTMPNLDGSAGQFITTDGAGNLSWATITGTNIYNSNGTLSGDRIVDMSTHDLTFSSTSSLNNLAISFNDGSDSTLQQLSAGSLSQTIIDSSGSSTAYNQNASNITLASANSGSTIFTDIVQLYNSLKIRSVNGATIRSLEANNSGIRINNAFYLPNVDGSIGQFITTDGAGNLSWATSTSVNIYNTDGTLTADRVVSQNNFSLTLDGGIGSNGAVLNLKTSASNRAKALNYYSGSNLRFKLRVSGTELGSNTGSSFAIDYVNDAGVTGTALTIGRSTGALFIANAYTLPVTDGTSGQALLTNGAGAVSFSNVVTSVGLTTGTTGTDVNVSGSPVTGSGSITLNIPTASATNRGALSSADWTTFNNKVSTNIYNGNGTLTGARNVDLNGHNFNIQDLLGTSTINITTDDGSGSYSYMNMVTGSVNITASGSSFSSTLQVTSGGVSIYKSGSAGAYILPITQPTANQIVYASSTTQLAFTSLKTINSNSLLGSGNISVGSVTSVGLTTGTTGTDVNVSGSPITGSGSFTLNIPTASATNRGALSSADWTTFNNKQGTISLTTTGTTGTAPTLVSNTLNIPRTPFIIQSACSDETTPLTTGTRKVVFRMPQAMTLTSVRASLTTAQTSGTIFTCDILQNGVSILSTKITIDNTETTSTTAVTLPVISTSALTDDAEISVSITQVGSGTATGLKVSLIGLYA